MNRHHDPHTGRHSAHDEPSSESGTGEHPHDPRLHHPDGDEGMPGELLDTPANMPGDQPLEDDPPTVSEVHGRESDD